MRKSLSKKFVIHVSLLLNDYSRVGIARILSSPEIRPRPGNAQLSIFEILEQTLHIIFKKKFTPILIGLVLGKFTSLSLFWVVIGLKVM